MEGRPEAVPLARRVGIMMATADEQRSEAVRLARRLFWAAWEREGLRFVLIPALEWWLRRSKLCLINDVLQLSATNGAENVLQ